MNTAIPNRSAFARRPVLVPGLGWMYRYDAARQWRYWLKPLLIVPRLPAMARRRFMRWWKPAPYLTDANGLRWAVDVFAK